jgi:hypothetical protein
VALLGLRRVLKRALTHDRQHVVLELNRYLPLWTARKIGAHQVLITVSTGSIAGIGRRDPGCGTPVAPGWSKKVLKNRFISF